MFNLGKIISERKAELRLDRQAMKEAKSEYRVERRKSLKKQYKAKARSDAKARVQRGSVGTRLAKGLKKGLKDVKKRNADTIFIEKRSKRLNTPGEIREIKSAKKRKADREKSGYKSPFFS